MGTGVNLKVPGLLFATMNLFSLGIYWCPLRESNSQPLITKQMLCHLTKRAYGILGCGANLPRSLRILGAVFIPACCHLPAIAAPLLKLWLLLLAADTPLRMAQRKPALCPLQSFVQRLPANVSSVSMSRISIQYLLRW